MILKMEQAMTTMPSVLSGQILSYPYLWARQSDAGETEGRKHRPVCVVVAVRRKEDGLTHLLLLAITTKRPEPGRIALEIPQIEQRRAGLDDLNTCWIILDEYNYDIVEASWYIEPQREPLGRFSKSFVIKVAGLFRQSAGTSTRRVNRTE